MSSPHFETVNGVEICETVFANPEMQIGTDTRFASIWVRVPDGEWVRTPYRVLEVVRDKCAAFGEKYVVAMKITAMRLEIMSQATQEGGQ